jgi:hypothetical protein
LPVQRPRFFFREYHQPVSTRNVLQQPLVGAAGLNHVTNLSGVFTLGHHMLD